MSEYIHIVEGRADGKTWLVAAHDKAQHAKSHAAVATARAAAIGAGTATGHNPYDKRCDELLVGRAQYTTHRVKRHSTFKQPEKL